MSNITLIKLFHENSDEVNQGEYIIRLNSGTVIDIHFEFEIFMNTLDAPKVFVEKFPSNKKKKYVSTMNAEIYDFILHDKIIEAFISVLILTSKYPDDDIKRRFTLSQGLMNYLNLDDNEYDFLVDKDNYTISNE